ncbi:SpoIIE family protein phosphatase [Streptomyces sp. ME08-AFT2]|uniref:SpoIIE family protein phosphatase n=1 Tax=Streptomyces sp. ME08-AFT2 TaxID=3028683 RepID=UPI0029B44C2D|nr:SpoIIE family protein phosphatase [Streptomyces sp. ME08-AFT2]MDX3307517.1 SpoIIE family protein phosphatase [Streptomyces sp. ME08-AFT2]
MSEVSDAVGEVLTARVTVDEQGAVTGWNTGAARLLGYAPEEAVGRPAARLLARTPTASDPPPPPRPRPPADESSPADAPSAGPRRPPDPRPTRAPPPTGSQFPNPSDAPLPEPAGTPATGLPPTNPPPLTRPALADLPRWHGVLVLRHRDGRAVEARVVAHHRIGDDGVRDWLLVCAVPGSPNGSPPGSPTGSPPRPQVDEDALARWGFLDSPCCATSVHDTDLRFCRSNRAAQRALGLGEEYLRGLRITDVLPTASARDVERMMRRTLETGEPRHLENVARAPGESRQHAWAVDLYRVQDEDGRILGVALTGHDMTEQHRARERLQLIAEASTRIGSTLDVTRTAQELADVAVPGLADFVSVDLLTSFEAGQEETTTGGPLPLRRVAHRSVLPGAPEAVLQPGDVDVYPESSPPAESLRTGRAVRRQVTESAIAAWVAGDPVRTARIRDFGLHSVIAVPLTARGTALGVAVLVRHRRPEPFQHDDVVLAEELAAKAAVCIDNAWRYTRERRTAVTLQRSLLPQRLPEQSAMEIASRYLPADARAGVGGDWFDVIPLSGARVALVVGDVVGHGIHASATMGRLRTAVRTLADIDLPPGELLTHLDDLVGRLATEADTLGDEGTAGDVGATCLYAVYDPVTRRCTLARAGHPLPAVARPDGTVELLPLPAGPPLGLGGLPFEALETELPEGSMLALYTDGLITSRSRDSDVDVGAARLCRALTAPAASLDVMCDAVLDSLLPRTPADDVALLLARTRVLDASRVATWDVDSDPAAVADARKKAVGRLADWGLADAAFVTELIVSELVTNAIRHGEPPVQLRLIHDRTLICEVSDAGGTAPHMRRARTYDEGGRGLLLVAQLSRRWGARPGTKGKTIWAEQDIEQPEGDTPIPHWH